MKRFAALLACSLFLALTGCAAPRPVTEFALEPGAAPRGEVLIVLSAADQIELADGQLHATGYFLSELVHPVDRLLAAGYDVTFATPRGVAPTLDRDSLNWLYWFAAGDARDHALARVEASRKLAAPRALESLSDRSLDAFDGVFVPGGHAPMVDLAVSPDMARVLRHFHEAGKPTALLCHAPAALLACLPARDGGRPWPYTGYGMAIFSKFEEGFSESFFLGSEVPYYIDEELERAGAVLEKSCLVGGVANATRDRELITGQNPYSGEALGDLLVEALDAYRRAGSLRPSQPQPLTVEAGFRREDTTFANR